MVLTHWTTPWTGPLVNLLCHIIFNFCTSIVCSTVPVPSGIFIPVFKIGASFGRIVGECMHLWFPYGMRYGGNIAKIIPGGYATVGAAAFSGAVTHTISVSVIVFEMTGQITHIIPIMIAVLLSNAIASLLAPSIYDSIILIKKLPYLPDLLPSSSAMYNIYVEDFMVRDVKYIYHGMTYEQLKSLLKENRRLQSFPLVDNPDSMVLLGSIQRIHLIQLIEKHIGRERRLQVVMDRQRQAKEKARQEALMKAEERKRRPSRFQVVPADDIYQRQLSDNEINQQTCHNPVFGCQPKKSILKKTNSFTMKGISPFISPSATPYSTVTGAESRIKIAFDAIFRKSSQLQDVNNDSQTILKTGSLDKAQIVPMSPTSSKKVTLPKERVCDMSPEDQRIWEEEQMQMSVDFNHCHIDPAPFQLVERTSLLKVHSLFSMVGVNHAYVTAIGKLVGVVGLKELRKAIEEANSGNLLPRPEGCYQHGPSYYGNSINNENDQNKEPDANTALMANSTDV
ncbi:unnamed protein product [Acanthoscelides obtectus]|nr:unnamed protein product [Acanthoscelides obtectus]CAK1640919.1 Chloride channel protein 2 [Acanthoscelides obtectus]